MTILDKTRYNFCQHLYIPLPGLGDIDGGCGYELGLGRSVPELYCLVGT